MNQAQINKLVAKLLKKASKPFSMDDLKLPSKFDSEASWKDYQRRMKHRPKTNKRSFKRGKRHYEIIEGSKRQRVFSLLRKHPNISNPALFKVFNASTKILQDVIRSYKRTFFRSNEANNISEANDPPFTYEDYENEIIENINKINKVYDKFNKQ